MLITSVQVFLGRPRQWRPVRLSFWTFFSPSIATIYMAVPSELAGADYLCQIVKLHPLQEIFRVDLVLGGCLHGVWSSWRTNCKIFLKKWWEISRRWGQAGALWICPMWHSILWWKGIHNQHLRINSPWGNRRVAPTPASPYPLWPLSLVCHLLGHH